MMYMSSQVNRGRRNQNRKPLTYFASSDTKIALILSVCPTNFPILFPLLGSHILTTLSGEPLAMSIPYGSAASAYTLDFADAFTIVEEEEAAEEEGAEEEEGREEGIGREEEREEEEGGWRVIRGDWDVRVGSQSLIVRSKEPEAIHWRSRLV